METTIDFSGDFSFFIVLDVELGDEGSLRPSQKSSQHLTSLVEIIIDRLFAQENEAVIISLDEFLENFGNQ